MTGSATFTIVMSSSSMKTPIRTAPSVHHLRDSSMATSVPRVSIRTVSFISELRAERLRPDYGRAERSDPLPQLAVRGDDGQRRGLGVGRRDPHDLVVGVWRERD